MMDTVLKDYPETPWKPGWRIASGPEDRTPFFTGVHGSLTVPDQPFTLLLTAPDISGGVRLFSNGLSIGARRHPDRIRVDVLATHPGRLCGTIKGLPPPRLTAETTINRTPDMEWLSTSSGTVLLLRRENRFALVAGESTMERALAKAEASLDEDPATLFRRQTDDRKKVTSLFSMNPRHNPPVLLAAENLTAKLRERTGAIHGLWSLADGFAEETFSLNELYPLIRAWNLIDPSVAAELMQTVMNLQQSAGGFPSWIAANGLLSSAAPWPLIAQSFEQVWQTRQDPAWLKKHLPALRKYIQWALRHFDPYRDRIPAWQSEQELFVPGNFGRGKATPELTVMLINELDAVLRLCEGTGQPEAAEQSLAEERDQLIRTLNTVFWNPELKAFSNAWKDGHYLHEPSFGSFIPLGWSGLDKDKQRALLESFEETHSFPGQKNRISWKLEDMDDTAHHPVIHQFMAFEALLSAANAKGLRMLFARRAREGFAAWFERETIEAARGITTGSGAYSLGPVTAALILTTQHEFVSQTAQTPTAAQLLLRTAHRLRFRTIDLRIILFTLLVMGLAHMLYTLSHPRDARTRVAEAAMNYQQGRFRDALRICRLYPDNALANFLLANILMLAEQPEQSEPLYRQALSREIKSPSALLGLALALQMNGDFAQAAKRYTDFIDIHGERIPDAAQLADEFRQLAREGFRKPPRWRRIYELPLMNDLGL